MVSMREKQLFFREFLRSPGQVSSVIPTRKSIVRRIAQVIVPGRKVIVEYGPGTGVLADAILQSGKLDDTSTLLLIEKSAALAATLRQKFEDPRIHVVNGSAEHVGEMLYEIGESCAQYIFTSIPITVMSHAVRERILVATKKALCDNGTFVAFLARKRAADILGRHFSITRVRRELFNIPPLFIFTMRHKTGTEESAQRSS